MQLSYWCHVVATVIFLHQATISRLSVTRSCIMEPTISPSNNANEAQQRLQCE
jgi:hypothetical protein